MTAKYGEHFQTKVTPQSEAIPGSTQVENSAGGFAFPVDKWTRLGRFLILGSEGGSYYASERELTRENATSVLACAKEDGVRTVGIIAAVSESGRAAKNDPALFALAICAGLGDKETQREALHALSRVARIPTHLFTFLTYVQGFRGWGRSLRRAVADWYTDRDIDRLAYHMAKYRQRGGWSNRDVLRKAHPKTDDPQRNAVFNWVTQGNADGVPTLIEDFVRLQEAGSINEVVQILKDNPSLSWEMVPTDYLGEAEVWNTLLPNLPMGALTRNLARMTANGLISPGSDASKLVVERLSNTDAIEKSRLHPIQALAALMTYRFGAGARGNLTWDPVASVVDALDDLFYATFGLINETGKRFNAALDVSGSMEWATLLGVPGLTPRMGSAAMAMTRIRTESDVITTAFTSGQTTRWSTEISTLPLSAKQRLDDVVTTVSGLPFGGTDCALPMLWALENKVEIDVFEIYTDSETWAGNIHPVQALRQYREKMGIPAKLIVVGMTANNFSIADPDDGGMLDVIGFDTAAPNIISDFAAI